MKKTNKVNYILLGISTFLIGIAPVLAVKSEYEYLDCGGNYIPAPISGIVAPLYTLLQIVLPIVLVVVGSLDFVKAVIASDQDKMKKSQNQFVKRLISAGTFFLVFTLIKFSVGIAADDADNHSLTTCLDCLFNNSESCGEIKKENPFIK